jgi:hypothetical protein
MVAVRSVTACPFAERTGTKCPTADLMVSSFELATRKAPRLLLSSRGAGFTNSDTTADFARALQRDVQAAKFDVDRQSGFRVVAFALGSGLPSDTSPGCVTRRAQRQKHREIA